MVREFVRDLEGHLAVKVINYEKVELMSLQEAVNGAQAEYDAAVASHNEASERLAQAEAALADSKSELEIGTSVAEEPGVDTGAEPTGGEDQAGADGAPGFAQDV